MISYRSLLGFWLTLLFFGVLRGMKSQGLVSNSLTLEALIKQQLDCLCVLGYLYRGEQIGLCDGLPVYCSMIRFVDKDGNKVVASLLPKEIVWGFIFPEIKKGLLSPENIVLRWWCPKDWSVFEPLIEAGIAEDAMRYVILEKCSAWRLSDGSYRGEKAAIDSAKNLLDSKDFEAFKGCAQKSSCCQLTEKKERLFVTADNTEKKMGILFKKCLRKEGNFIKLCDLIDAAQQVRTRNQLIKIKNDLSKKELKKKERDKDYYDERIDFLIRLINTEKEMFKLWPSQIVWLVD